jgi:hypothetical protein
MQADNRIELLDHLKKYPGVKELTVNRKPSSGFAITFIRDSERISYFSMISTVGLPQDITAQEFRIECMFPAESRDDEKSISAGIR